MKYIDLENTDRNYYDLLVEISEMNEKINNEIVILLTGIIASNSFSEQEYKVFTLRIINKSKFKDIALTLSLSLSSVKTYYKRAIDKLNASAIQISSKKKAYRI
ncbi:MAG: sigma factor-like helix-turn-helix DNA-binding protein [bacterium]